MSSSSSSGPMTSSEESTSSSISGFAWPWFACHLEFSRTGLRFQRSSRCACCGGGSEQTFLPWKAVDDISYTPRRYCRPSALRILDVNANELVLRAVGKEDFEELKTSFDNRNIASPASVSECRQ